MKIKITAKAESKDLFYKEFDESNCSKEELLFLADSSSAELFYFLLTKMDVSKLSEYRNVTFDKEITFSEPAKTISYEININN